MAPLSKIQEAEDLVHELEGIEKDSVELFKATPLVPEPYEMGADGASVKLFILHWHMNDIQAVKSREIALRYDAWYQKASVLV